ncbi:MAG: type I secretion system permease/ATPase [Candidatus Paracaedibacteraceae bacterium]|nr:type I secretion system permease/ATPase [Candidatus Paracaedibacteraceae bacterium]
MSLIAALELYTHLKGAPQTKESLLAGIAAGDENSLEYFSRVAARVGLEAKEERRPLAELYHFSLPCFVRLKNDDIVVVTKVGREDITYISPQDWDTKTTCTLIEFNDIATDTVIHLSHTLRPKSDFFSVFGWFWNIIKQHKSLYFQAGLAGGIVNLFLIVTTFYSLTVYDRVVPHQGYDTLWVLTIGVLFIYLLDGTLRIIRSNFIDQASKKADVQIGSSLFEKLMNARMDFKPASSASMAFHLKEFESLREFMSSGTLVTLSDLPYTILLLIVIGLIAGNIVFIPIIAIILILLVSFLVQPSLSNYVKRLNEVSENKYSTLINSLINLEVVKSFNMHTKVQTQWENVLTNSAELSHDLKHFSHVVGTITSIIQNIAYVMIIVAGVYKIGEGDLTFGGLIACSILTSRTLGPVSQIVGLIGRINQSIFSIRELSHIMNMPQERQTHQGYQGIPNLNGTVEFINVDFNYPGQRLKSLRNFNLNIPSGSRLAFIGRVGSGKTTFEKLLMGLYQPSSGHILVDGIDVGQLDPFELRNHIGYVPQDITLWRGTLRHNIMAGLLKVDDDKFMQVCELAGVMDFVRLHPQGFNMMIGEDGSGLSQGQKQAVALARALITDPKIILMDEPTASMDPQSEANFLERLNHYLTDQTLILVTHRMTALGIVNRVVLVEQGQVFMDGPRDDVLRKLSEVRQKNTEMKKNDGAES